MVMKTVTTLEDLVGIEHCKLGFYQELQQKVEQLKTSNQELEKKRKEIQAVLDGITDLMVVLSEDLQIQQVNHVFTEWFPGIDPIGRHLPRGISRQQKQMRRLSGPPFPRSRRR
jgi:two-component system, NtrC family, sensor kinase